MSTVVHVLGNDWAGVYVNGELVAEGHSISPYDWEDVVKRLGHRMEQVEADPSWLESVGSLPAKLGHVQPRR